MSDSIADEAMDIARELLDWRQSSHGALHSNGELVGLLGHKPSARVLGAAALAAVAAAWIAMDPERVRRLVAESAEIENARRAA